VVLNFSYFCQESLTEAGQNRLLFVLASPKDKKSEAVSLARPLDFF
jgi:hypothetical protein